VKVKHEIVEPPAIASNVVRSEGRSQPNSVMVAPTPVREPLEPASPTPTPARMPDMDLLTRLSVAESLPTFEMSVFSLGIDDTKPVTPVAEPTDAPKTATTSSGGLSV